MAGREKKEEKGWAGKAEPWGWGTKRAQIPGRAAPTLLTLPPAWGWNQMRHGNTDGQNI